MSASRSTSQAPSRGASQRKWPTLPAIIAVTVACCAVVAGAAWGPFVMGAASNLRPVTALPGAVPPPYEINAAREQVWNVVIVSFIALAVLATVAVFVGRWAFPSTAATRARREKWALLCLIGGVALGLAPVLLTAARVMPSYGTVLVLSLPLAGAVAGFFLSGIALPSAADSVRLLDEVRPRGSAGTRFCLAASIIVAFLVAALIAFIAQVIVGFFLHFV